ncbi:MAG: hypothetical protein COC01_09780 [Bacteroidetes bacterium]|nr:MAG: hypothetical protein COC01_09780 [Bacteroidota bacterium]
MKTYLPLFILIASLQINSAYACGGYYCYGPITIFSYEIDSIVDLDQSEIDTIFLDNVDDVLLTIGKICCTTSKLPSNFKWYRNNLLISDTTMYVAHNKAISSYLITRPGYFKITLTNPDNTIETYEVVALYKTNPLRNLPASVSETDDMNPALGIKLYPNPVIDYLNWEITYFPEEYQYVKLSIVDRQGKTVYTTPRNDLLDIYFEPIYLGNLSAGLYFLVIESDNNRTIKKILKS